MYSTASTTYKQKDVRWAQNAHHHTLTYLWVRLKNDIYTPRILHKTRLFLRYIDDLFFIWKGTENELQQFLEEINQVHPTIKFDYETSKTDHLNFLDIRRLYMTRIPGWETSTTKARYKFKQNQPIGKHTYTRQNSAHPYHLKKSIPYGQASYV